jgi:hypothetical protein
MHSARWHSEQLCNRWNANELQIRSRIKMLHPTLHDNRRLNKSVLLLRRYAVMLQQLSNVTSARHMARFTNRLLKCNLLSSSNIQIILILGSDKGLTAFVEAVQSACLPSPTLDIDPCSLRTALYESTGL